MQPPFHQCIRNKVILHELCTQKTPKLFSRSHAAELGNPVPKEPLLFLKPVSSYVEMGGAIEVKPLPLAHVHVHPFRFLTEYKSYITKSNWVW